MEDRGGKKVQHAVGASLCDVNNLSFSSVCAASSSAILSPPPGSNLLPLRLLHTQRPDRDPVLMLAGRHGEAVGPRTGSSEPGEKRRAAGKGAEERSHTPGRQRPVRRDRPGGERGRGARRARSQALLGGVRGGRPRQEFLLSLLFDLYGIR